MRTYTLLAPAAAALALIATPAFAETLQETAQPPEIPPPMMDTDGDGTPDAWDRDGDGRPDAWDTDSDGQPDALDNNGDGTPDALESDDGAEPE